MKKFITLTLLFSISLISAQSSYSEYKKQRDYEQKYNQEVRQKNQQEFNAKVKKAFNEYAEQTNQYYDLVTEYKSTEYVLKNYPKLCKSLDDNWIFLSGINFSSYDDTENLKYFRHIWFVLQDRYPN
jgi:hypothetical protein